MVWGQVAQAVDLLHVLDKEALAVGSRLNFRGR
jgi:hypothetical protein